MKLIIALVSLLCFLPASGSARDIKAELQNAERFGGEAGRLVVKNQVRTFWSEDGLSMVFSVNTDRDSTDYFRLELKTGERSPAFDPVSLAKALSQAASRDVNAKNLPLETIVPGADKSQLRFRAFGSGWRYDIQKNEVVADQVPPKNSPLLAPGAVMRQRQRSAGSSSVTFENATDGEIEVFWVENRNRKKSYGKVAPGKDSTFQTYDGHAWVVGNASGKLLAGVVAGNTPSVARVTGEVKEAPTPRRDHSPDGKWRAFTKDRDLFIEPVGGGEAIRLNSGSQPNVSYSWPLEWSPDSSKLIAYRANDVPTLKVTIVQSSPPDQLQPKLKVIDYVKPGDPIHQPKPCLFDVSQRREIAVDDALFDNPWQILDGEWTADGAEYQMVYNQRGHQLMRILGIRGDSGATRVIHEERSKTFIDYSQKYEFRRIQNGAQILWASEKDGYNHLYRIDAKTGRIINAVTSGHWNVLEIVDLDETNQRLLLKVNGAPGSDPYHVHFARVNMDGSGFTRLTESDGNHSIEFSPDGKWLIATWSRVDQPQTTEIRDAENGRLIAEISRADDSALIQSGWSRPERFTAKGRDGKTDIYGYIIKPRNFDPAKKYPVVEDIYAGPHDFFVPKSFFPWSGENVMAELGFVVVKIDGMGTNWRSKTFHDVAWKNLKDSGFPDRIPWLKAAAATRPWMDIGRMGIYGGSAGGQSALSALLHHGDFYKVAVADCGCHDNRMDKIWWNEAWMGWPVDQSYAESSNVDNAAKLKGDLLLIVGELDDNVDPASTSQVVAALQRAGKHFDYVPIMNAGHGAAESPYGKYRRAEFLVRHLQGK
jgi:dipeptidyl aminopeptidase/acylaminoacyl peptidase